MHSEMRRPPTPALSDWEDALDSQLRDQVQTRHRSSPNARRAPHVFDPVLRVARSLARPLAHGGAAVAAAVVVFTAMSTSHPGPATNSAAMEEAIADVAVVASEATSSFPVVLLTATRAPDVALLPIEDARMLAAADITRRQDGLTGAPRSNAPAVPTPDGGGEATATLRPRVR